MTNPIPKHATRYEYQAARKTGIYYIWRSGKLYYWASLGNGGSESSFEAAQQAAREWIKRG